jgi:hypothetical protein
MLINDRIGRCVRFANTILFIIGISVGAPFLARS